MTRQELEQVLTHHHIWVNSGGREGASADFSNGDLYGANLRDANLHGADLSGANLRWANLSGADLRWANLHGANLSGADLRDANLYGANLSGADLRWADLRGASLSDANLHGANLHGADLHGANLYGANLHGANLHGAAGIPVAVDSGDRLREVAAVATASHDGLYMNLWHTCPTTHCIAGWAIHLAGEPGRLLEEVHGPELAGRMLLGHEAALHFHDDDNDARAWLLSVLDS
jgi:hypothetical protein